MNFVGLRSTLESWLHRQWLKKGIWAWCTAPLALLFGLILKLRHLWFAQLRKTLIHKSRIESEQDIPVPVLIVGNIYVGGTGKTPIVIELVKALRERGWHPGVISRGYGTSIGKRPLVSLGALDANCFGDEPALIGTESGAPVAVHPNRLQACKDLLKNFPEIDLVISDDGLQHRKLKRDLELVVQDSRRTGNGWLLPAGPLREPKSRLKTVHGILTRKDNLNGNPPRPITDEVRNCDVTLEIANFKNLSTGQLLDPGSFVNVFKNKSIAAVAGVARPERFFSDLRNHGLCLGETLALPDHFPYDQSPFLSLKSECIVVTSKDAVKLLIVNDPRIWVANAKIIFSDPEFLNWLDERLQHAATQHK